MTRLNFKKMYLISEEKYQTLTKTPSQSSISNINDQSFISSENRLNNTPIIHNQNPIDPHTHNQIKPITRHETIYLEMVSVKKRINI